MHESESIDLVRLDELVQKEVEFRSDHPWVWASTLYGPGIVSLSLLFAMWVYAGWEFTSRLVVNVSLALWLLGRFIILSGSEGGLQDFDGSMSSFQLFILICYLDTITALVLAFHIGFLFRLPVIGPRVAALVADGRFILESHPWMRRTTSLGLIVFVGFPLAATGSVGGSIFGRLLGMSRVATFSCICFGSLIGNGAMFWFSDILGNWVDKDHPAIQYGGIIVVLLLVIILERRYQSLRKQFLHRESANLLPANETP